MKQNVAITGATGMIGKIMLQHCLDSERVSSVVSLVRKPSVQVHSKLREVVVKDFSNCHEVVNQLAGIDIAYFCLGAYTGALPDDQFKTVTVDYAVGFGKVLHEQSPEARFCLLSGAGADTTEQSRVSFARYKGMAENQLTAIFRDNFYAFRPGYIYPVERRKEPNISYAVFRFLYPVVNVFAKNFSVKSTELGKVIFSVGLHGSERKVFENVDIRNFKA